MDFMFDWEVEGDRFSFEDSDRFEEDSLCSWISEPESLCNNWRGWRKQNGGNSQSNQLGDKGVTCLLELTAQAVASSIPFEVVEHFYPPIPEQLQLRIAFWSFPENEEDIRLYSCLANGSADEFQKGEHLYKTRAIKDPLQIGFHLSATVIPPQSLAQAKGNFNVAVVFDRRRVTSCTCTCNPQASWCAHVVALCLFRILQPNQVCLRAPVSESLSRLHRDQLQKFAQYLISELPQQILPTAQRLLDELLSSQQSEINRQGGAPDPTAGASASEHTAWCLDEQALHDNIKKTLVKFCVPAPIVFSDVNYLTSTAPPAAAEWQNLLRPLRGREPEGMWNLLSIVREMYKRNDSNAIPLLEILTEEVMACETVNLLVWWFQTKISASHNSVTCYSRNSNASNQHAAASLCDEIVTLWRLAALNPSLSTIQRDDLETKLRDWHIKTIDRVRKARGNTSGNNANPIKKTDIELFSGFKSSIEACQLDWTNYPIAGVTFIEKEQTHSKIVSPLGKLHEGRLSQSASLLHKHVDKLLLHDNFTEFKLPTAPTDGNASSSSEGFCENDRDLTQRDSDCSMAEETVHTMNNIDTFQLPVASLPPTDKASVSQDNDQGDAGACLSPSQSVAAAHAVAMETAARNEGGEAHQSSDEYQMYYFDPRVKLEEKKREKKPDEANYFANIRSIENRHEILFARAESLHAHGHTRHACTLARQLAEEMLANPPDLMTEPSSHSAKGKKKKCSANISSFTSTTLAKAAFLCMVLLEDAECHYLAFQMGMFGLEMPRQPASSKALEVKLANQECELVALLKKIPLGHAELNVIRDRAEQLRDGKMRSRGDALLPLMLASFIFDSLCLPAIPVNGSNNRPPSRPVLTSTGRLSGDEQLGFEAAVAALGLKANVSEAEHALLCEGNRRQRGDLGIAMLVQYKDDQEKLDKILDKLLDKEIHSLYKAPSLTTYLNSSKQKTPSTNTTQTVSSTHARNCSSSRRTVPSLEYLNLEQRIRFMDLSGGAKPKILPSESSRDTDSSAMEEEGDNCDYKAWEAKFRCTSLRNPKKHSVGMASIDSSAPETTSSDNSPTLIRRNWTKAQGPGSDSGSSGKSSDSIGSSSSGDKGARSKIREDESPSSIHRLNAHTMVDTRGGLPSIKGPRFKGKNRMPTIPNQPSEASAHFMFELAKTVLAKAGGSSSTSLFTQPNASTSHGTSHRALHLCAFQIGLYALGLHNCVSPNWLSRTYSSHVSWITGQAMEIGSAAINILIDTWDGHLTPPEVASLGDRASRGRDPNMVRAAAELALSCLPHANALNPNEIQRALNQCKEQSREMLERACLAVETAAKDGGVYPEVLFEVARRWYELYEEAQQGAESHDHHVHIDQDVGAQALVPLQNIAPLQVMDQDSVHVFAQAMSQQQSGLPPMAVPMSYAIPTVPSHHYPMTSYVQQMPGFTGQYSQAHIPIHTVAPSVHPAYITNYSYPNQQFQAHAFSQPQIQGIHALYPTNPQQMRPSSQQTYQIQPMHTRSPVPSQIQQLDMPVASTQNMAHSNPPQVQPVSGNSQHMNYLHAAFRVSMLAMEMLGRRVHDDRPQTKYARNPPYGEDVKWSLKVAMKLGTNFLQQFTSSVVNAVVSPFILQDIAFDSAQYLSRNNPSQVSALLRSNVLNPLIQKCLQMFSQCIHQRLHHIQQSEYDEFVSIVCSARNAFCITPGGMVQFNDLLQSLRRAKSCKKDLWMRIVNGLATGQIQ